MANTSRGVTVVAKLLGGKKVETESKAIGRSFDETGKAVKKADEEAGRASKGWELFSSRQKKAVDDAKKTHNVLKSITGAAAGLAGGYIGFSTVSSAIDKVKESAAEVNKLQSMGVGGSDQQTLDVLAAFKARGIGAEVLGKTMKKLATATQSAERQEYTYGVALNKNNVSLASRHAALAKAEESGNAYAIAQAKRSLSGVEMSSQLGTSATAFKELGLNAQSFKKLAPEKQFEMIATKLSALPPSAEKTRIATQLLGRGAAALLPIFNRGALGWQAQLKAAKEFMPQLGKGKQGFEELEVREARMSMATEGLKLSLGSKLIPIITKVMAFVTKLSVNVEHGNGVWGKLGKVIGGTVKVFTSVWGWIEKTKAAQYGLAGALTILSGLWVAVKIWEFLKAIKAIWLATKLWTAVQWLFNAALDANPIGLAILGIAALIAIGAVLLTHWKQVNKFFVGMWTWIKDHWKLLAQILLTPILGPAALIIFHWKQVVSFFQKVPNELASAGKGMWDFVKEGFRDAINWVIKAWDSLHFKIPGIKTPFGSVGGINISVPHIPLMAEGGTVRSGGAAIVGERGPELLSLPAGARVDPLLPEGRSGGNQPGTWRTNQNGDLIVICQIDRKEIGRAVVNDLGSLEARR